jgi:membrane-bound ClpP family serine protease
MKTLIVVTALMSGILLILVPRFILPVCEYEGYPAMHCSDTARAEYVVGALLLVVGIGAFLLKSTRTSIIGAAVSIILYIIAFLLPDKYGYCHSSRMPCNYGTVPGIRFIAIIGGIIMVFAIISVVRSTRKKGNT